MDISLNGIIYKYTNFVYGYQERYFKLKNGVLSYYLSRQSVREGCRKSYRLTNFFLEFDKDSLRIDLVFSDNYRWSLRFRNDDEFTSWKKAFEALINASGGDGRASTSSSCVSPLADSSAYALLDSEHSDRQLTEQDYVTLQTMKDVLSERFVANIRLLEKVTEQMSDSETRFHLTNSEDATELITNALQSCRTLKQDVICLKKILKTLSKKVDSRQRSNCSDHLHSLMASPSTIDCGVLPAAIDTTLSSEGNNRASAGQEIISLTSLVSDEEQWEDALDEQNVSLTSTKTSIISAQTNEDSANTAMSLIDSHLLDKHVIYHEIQRITTEQLHHAFAPVDGSAGWEKFFTDGEMRMYRMEKESDDGIACDPLKALHSVKGISAREYIDTFFEPSIKQTWDDTLVSTRLVERLHEHTNIIHQLHKRIWPSAQRESLFWSQRVDASAHREPGALDAFLVCNHSTEHKDVSFTNSCVRVRFKIAMLCQTYLTNSTNVDVSSIDKSKLKREDVVCKIVYVAQIHPGGWVPAAGVRQLAKREYPKFLRQFTNFVEKRVRSQPLTI